MYTGTTASRNPPALGDPVDRVLSRLTGVRRSGDGWTACCPAHEDRRASLSVGRGDDGRVLLHCHAGCAPEQIAGAIGLELRDLFPPSENGRHGPTIVATYDYRDERGELLYQAVRLNPKDFRLRRPDGAGGWTWKIGDTRRVLYRLPEVLAGVQAGRTIYIVEGEKDADALARGGLIATTNPMGAGKWRREYAEVLGGANVCIVPDNDDAGRAHADDVARSLHDIAAEVRVLTLEGLPAKGDVSDWLAAGGTIEQIDEMAFYAPQWTGGDAAEAGQGATRATAETRHAGEEVEPLFRWEEMRAVRFRDRTPPPRQMLIDGFLPAGVAGIQGASGGAGKGYLGIQLCMSIATGVPFLGMAVQRVGYAAFVTAEDDEDELHRRQYRIAEHYAELSPIFDRDAMEERLLLIPRVGELNLLTRMIDSGDVHPTPLVDRLLAALERIPGLELLILDPLNRWQGGRGSWEEHAVRFVEVIERIRLATGATVIVQAHVSKAGARDGGGAEIIKGSTSWVDNFRWAATMQPMRRDQAVEWGLSPDEAAHHVRLELPKANYIRPWPGMWLRRCAGGVLEPATLQHTPDAGRQAAAEDEREAIIARCIDALQEHGPTPRRDVEREWASTTGILRVGRRKAMGAIAFAIAEGRLVEFEGAITRSNGRPYTTTLIGLPQHAPGGPE